MPGREEPRKAAGNKQGRRSMPTVGTVKFFNSEKGYGFIKPDSGGQDVFVHVSAVMSSGLGTLNEGQRVSFEVEPDKRGKGPKAVNLQSAG
jgi:CspA family cold shock protein